MVATPSPSVPLPKGEGREEVKPKEEGGQVLLPPGEGFRMRGEFIWSPAPEISSGIYLVKAKMGNSEIKKRVIYSK